MSERLEDEILVIGRYINPIPAVYRFDIGGTMDHPIGRMDTEYYIQQRGF